MKKFLLFFLVLAILFALIPTTYGKIKRIQSNDFLSDEIYSVIVVFDEPSVVEYKSSVSYKLLSIFFLLLKLLMKQESKIFIQILLNLWKV